MLLIFISLKDSDFFFFLVLSPLCSLYILYIKTLSDAYLQRFSHTHCLFIVLIISFAWQNIYIYNIFVVLLPMLLEAYPKISAYVSVLKFFFLFFLLVVL